MRYALLLCTLALGCGSSKPATVGALKLGQLVAETVEASHSTTGVDVAVTPEGAFVVGTYVGALTDRGAKGDRGAFAHRIGSSTGWPHAFPAGSWDAVRPTAVAAEGDVVAVALSQTMKHRPPVAEVVALSASTGNKAWAYTPAIEAGYVSVRDLAIASDGSTYVVGNFTGTLEVAGTKLRADGIMDGFVIALDPNGRPRWGQRFGGPEGDEATAVAVSDELGIIVAGQFSGESSVGRATLESNDDSVDAMVFRLRTDGAMLWTVRIGGPGTDSISGVAITTGIIAVIGTFDRPLLFAQKPTTPVGASDIFVAAINPDGQPAWLHSLGGPGADLPAGIASSDGKLAIAGSFAADSVVGGKTVSGSFYAELSAQPSQPSWQLETLDGPVDIAGLGGHRQGRYALAGTARGPVEFSSGRLDSRKPSAAFVIAPGKPGRD